MSKKCTSCGKEVVDEAKFCPGCGGSSFASQEIPATQYAQPVQQQVAPQPVQQAPAAAKGGIKWWQILIIVVAVVAVIGIIAGIFLTKDGGSDKPDDDGGAVVEQQEEKEDNNVEIGNEDAAENDAPVADSDELNGASVINYGSKKISLPCTVSDVLELGFVLDDYYDITESTTLAPGENIEVNFESTDEDADGSVDAYVVNFSDQNTKIKDATVVIIEFYEVAVPAVSVKGITIGETKEDGFKKLDVLTDSDYIYAGTALCNIEFYMDSTYGFVKSITVENYPEDMKKFDVEFDFSNEEMSFNKAKEAALFSQFVDIDKYYDSEYDNYSNTYEAETLPEFKSATVDGDKVVRFDMSYNELKALGFSLSAEHEEEAASTGSWINLYGVFNSKEKGFLAGFGSTKKGATCKEGNTIGFEFGNSGHTQLGDDKREFYVDFEVFGLTQDSNIRDVVDMYGDPKDIYSSIYSGKATGTATYYTSDEIKVEIDFDLYSGAIISVSII
ncbi:MAG: zinc ribbon domain-containing protein [Clostridia bacterium]|nr:zinc ribbon domain-containing protein [Clostridia bacterium]